MDDTREKIVRAAVFYYFYGSFPSRLCYTDNLLKYSKGYSGYRCLKYYLETGFYKQNVCTM